MEKSQLLSPAAAAPPPYKAHAYPRQSRRRFVARRLMTIRAALSFIITVAVLWLCYAVTGSSWYGETTSSEHVSPHILKQFHESRAQCEALTRAPPLRPRSEDRTSNPRWLPSVGQQKRVVLRNAKLFDGESYVQGNADIVFSKGLIESVSPSLEGRAWEDAVEYDLHGRFVTPGLVDMHSHALVGPWPSSEAHDDGNEMHPDTKAFTPSVRVIDAMKPHDLAIPIICSGGVTSSLIIPGSANLMGGEGAPVKNVLYSGEHGEPVVEDILLERGVPVDERHRYMKMAYGENPRSVWGYTRLGNGWHLREHMQKAKELMTKQDDYCATLDSTWNDRSRTDFVRKHGEFPFNLELETTVGVLRGRVSVHNHNYEPEDLETMLRIGREFGFTPKAFHHAIEAWQVPEMLKEQGHNNITIATFAEFSLYKFEAYSPTLYAGKILSDHDVPVAYKSDHSSGWLSAKYLASQAAVGHAFLLPEDKALQSVTSVPARAIELDYRIGYCRQGYDADLVIWDTDPLALGATPLQVFVDGMPQLNDSAVKQVMGASFSEEQVPETESRIRPQQRFEPEDRERKETCSRASAEGQNFIISGIERSFLKKYPGLAAFNRPSSIGPLEMVIGAGEILCLGSEKACTEDNVRVKATGDAVHIHLENGHVVPGFTAVTGGLGMREIAVAEDTGDGEAAGQKTTNPESIVYAKDGVWLDGKPFARARLGGVTRAITQPFGDASGMVHGVSAEILTSGKKTLLDGGIVQEDVALHMVLGEATKISEGTISNGVKNIRKMLKDGKAKHNETIFGRVADGELPLVVYCNNKYDMEQLVRIKNEYPETNIVIMGGREASFVAHELAGANISMILTEDRPSPDNFRDKDAISGPPLSRSVASYLVEAEVEFALAISSYPMRSDYRIHDLGAEAMWTAKFAGLFDDDAVEMLSTKVESILGLKPSKDLVIYEGSPLQYGATVVLSFHSNEKTGKLEVATCFPREVDE